MADSQLILHVKGTEETTSVPKPTVRAGIADGKIRYSQLIWSPLHHAWKQVREMPHLWPSQKLAPAPVPKPLTPPGAVTAAPTPRAIPAVAPKPRSRPQATAVPVPTAKVAAPPKVTLPAAHPKIAVAAAQPKIAQPAIAPRIAAPMPVPVPMAVTPVEDQDEIAAENRGEGEILPPDEMGFKGTKWACLVVGAILLLAVSLNYFLVDRPLVTRLAQTPFAHIPVHAHLGAFVQPGALVIHIPASRELNASNFATFLVALARSTPTKPGSEDVFDRVSLTQGWTGQYSFAGSAWDTLAQMSDNNPDQQRDFILSQLDTATGDPLAGPDASQDARDQAWTAFVGDFTRP